MKFLNFWLKKFQSQNLNTTWKWHWLQCQSLKKSSSKRTHRAWTNLPFVWSQELTAHWLQQQDLFPRCRRSEIPFCMLLLTEGWHLRMSIWLLDVGSIFWDAKGNKVCSGSNMCKILTSKILRKKGWNICKNNAWKYLNITVGPNKCIVGNFFEMG